MLDVCLFAWVCLHVQEEGESGTGYSKEMSKEFIDAEVRAFRCRQRTQVLISPDFLRACL